ncbi:hypothetical protein HBI81_052560 [Parastagonospora nodorum]|nr:hypothetical protein HBI09_194470 [Parastagonospora nodorum]KAH4051191.1 hypothetical protein HBH49_114260 [Parastagonospora nodorum]KAH4111931.1 hypothetical protein HBH47_233450 [Parastagonospora nodorum]KAH4178772.1 hypothetical protein HBH43_028460 [Parastagonospora nodorum]KAH4612220.1 hypothetical protein HBH82_028650 [Parastagonospora nodorum]
MAVGARLGFTIAMMKEMARAEAAGAFVIDKRKVGCALASSRSPDSKTYRFLLLSQISATRPRLRLAEQTPPAVEGCAFRKEENVHDDKRSKFTSSRPPRIRNASLCLSKCTRTRPVHLRGFLFRRRNPLPFSFSQ